MPKRNSKPRAVVSWSGGKDCCLALHRARRSFDIVGLIAMMTEDESRNRSHGLRPEILRRQADALGLPLLTAGASWQDYEGQFTGLLKTAAERLNVSHAIFGDIFPEEHIQWAERIAQSAGLRAVEPLQGESTYALASEFIRIGGEAIIVSASGEKLGAEWLGKRITANVLDEFLSINMDPGGENGEYHTVVRASPDFRFRIGLTAVEKLSHGGYALLNLTVG